MYTYKVFIKSVPGMYSQYNGYVPVQAKDENSAIEKAFRKLKTTTFPDRTRSMWTVDSVQKEV